MDSQQKVGLRMGEIPDLLFRGFSLRAKKKNKHLWSLDWLMVLPNYKQEKGKSVTVQ